MSDARIVPDAGEPTRWEFPWGEVVAFSRCSPERELNEDSAAVVSTPVGAMMLAIDGMGGQSAGRAAGRLALERVVERARGAKPAKSALRHALLDGIEAANRAVMDLGLGAGATLAAITIHDGQARTVHVGDAYALHVGQRGRIKSQTVSHSPTGYGVEAGLLDEAEAMVHEERHLVLNYVGHRGLRIEVGPSLQLATHDTLLVASDGLTDNLTQDEIVAIVRKGPLLRAAEALGETATERMRSPRGDRPSKPDDLTFVLCRPSSFSFASLGEREPLRRTETGPLHSTGPRRGRFYRIGRDRSAAAWIGPRARGEVFGLSAATAGPGIGPQGPAGGPWGGGGWWWVAVPRSGRRRTAGASAGEPPFPAQGPSALDPTKEDAPTRARAVAPPFRTMSSRSPLGSGLRSRVALVAVALGALALVAVPRRPPTALELEARRQSHALRLARAELLGAIEAYRFDHGSWPGVLPEGAHDRPHSARALRQQLLHPTDERGRFGKEPSRDAARRPFGPYLRTIPANPLDGSGTLHVVGRDGSDPTGALGAGGWLFDPRTGSLRSNAARIAGGDA